MPTGVDERVKRIYLLVALDSRSQGWSKRKIHEESLSRLARLRHPPGPPSRSWAYQYLREIQPRIDERGWLEEPWSLGSLVDPRFGPSPARVHELLLLARHARIAESQFTIRQALWASRLADVVSAYGAASEVARIQGLLMFSQQMAEEELWAELLGRPFDTKEDYDVEATNYWAHFAGPALGGGESYDTGFRLNVPSDRRGPMSEAPPAVDSRRHDIQTRSDTSDLVRRGPNLYQPQIERLVMAIDQFAGPGEDLWSDQVTIDQFEIALMGLKRASDLIEDWDDIPDQRIAGLAAILTTHLTESSGRLSLDFVGPAIDEWRATDGEARG